MGDFIRARDVAAQLDVSIRTVWLWTRSGRLPEPIRLGKVVRWRQADINALPVKPPQKKTPVKRRLRGS